MLVLPLLFVFVIFSLTKVTSLGVPMPVTDIVIRNKPADGTIMIDLAEPASNNCPLDVEILPLAASNRDYVYSVEAVGNSELAAIEVVKGEGGKEDTLVAKSVGMAKVQVKSADGAHTDNVTVVVTSSKAYDFSFSLYAADDEEKTDLLASDGGSGYVGTLPAGLYRYRATAIPVGSNYLNPSLRAVSEEGNAFLDEFVDSSAGTILLPYAGKAVFEVSIADMVDGVLPKRVEIDVAAPTSEGFDFTVDGGFGGDAEVGVLGDGESWETTVTRYIGLIGAEDVSADEISVTLPEDLSGFAEYLETEVFAVGAGRFAVRLHFTNTLALNDSAIPITIGVRGRTHVLNYTFKQFSFTIRTDLGDVDGGAQRLLLDTSVSFYATPNFKADNVVYVWDLLTTGGTPFDEADYADSPIQFGFEGERVGDICTVKAVGKTSVVVRARAARDLGEGEYAFYDGVPSARVSVEVTEQISELHLSQAGANASKAQNSLGMLTVAGSYYEGNSLNIVDPAEPRYEAELLAVNRNGANVVGGQSFILCKVVDAEGNETNDLAEAHVENTFGEDGFVNGQKLVVTRSKTGTRTNGEVTVVVEWEGNASYGTNARTSATFNVAWNAVEVRTSEQLFDAMETSGREVVLGADIMLGTDREGNKLSYEELRNKLHAMRSTYNIEYYTANGNPGDGSRDANGQLIGAYVNYVLEFTHSVYGNGYSINAENFTNAVDKAGKPIFRGPLYFVAAGINASVAGQDNIAFLCRTDGVTLYNTVLLGCSDESLRPDGDESGSADLSLLNRVGTTLDVNADVNILNCRVRNGRNVIRTYGGNRDGSRYFIGSLSENRNNQEECINVRIEGCIITQGREFLLKLGTNRALRASNFENLGVEPDLVGPNGGKYSPQSNSYLDDSYFNEMYVLTRVKLKDSVLERSGLFTIGVESNFAGEFLFLDSDHSDLFGGALRGWAGTGGTSFPAVLEMEGDVRLYDWKELDLIDSSTLISIGDNASENYQALRLDIASMLRFVKENDPSYGQIIQTADGVDYVHGGIAVYGGGKNYAQIDTRGLKEDLADAHEYRINIGVLKQSEDRLMSLMGEYLPYAAGTQDFRFYLYGSDSAFNYERQRSDEAEMIKYQGVKPVSLS